MFPDFETKAGTKLPPFWDLQCDEGRRIDDWEEWMALTNDEQYLDPGAFLTPEEDARRPDDEYVEDIVLCDVHPSQDSILIRGEMVTTSHSLTVDLGNGRRVVIEKDGATTVSVYASRDKPPTFSTIIVGG